MTDSPEGQTQSYSQEEEIRAGFERCFPDVTYLELKDNVYVPRTNMTKYGQSIWAIAERQNCRFEGWKAALASQAEQVRKLEADRQYHMNTINRLAKAIGCWDTSEIVVDTAIKQLTQANETIAALQARIAEYLEQVPVAWRGNNGDIIYDIGTGDTKEFWKPLYISPQIHSERELALLAVIEQMRGPLQANADAYNKDIDGSLYDAAYDLTEEALALTPDISALDAYFKRRFDEVMAAAYPKGKP